MGQHVAERAAFLPACPAGDELGDGVVEAEEISLPQLEHRDRGERLPGRVPQHDVVGAERPPGPGLADGDVEHGLARDRDVALRALVPALLALALEHLDDAAQVDGACRRRVKSGRHGAEA